MMPITKASIGEFANNGTHLPEEAQRAVGKLMDQRAVALHRSRFGEGNRQRRSGKYASDSLCRGALSVLHFSRWPHCYAAGRATPEVCRPERLPLTFAYRPAAEARGRGAHPRHTPPTARGNPR